MSVQRLKFKGLRRKAIRKFLAAVDSIKGADDTEALRVVANPNYVPSYLIVPGSANRTALEALETLVRNALSLSVS